MSKSFLDSLISLPNQPVTFADNNVYPESGQASVTLRFSEGATFEINYWRLIKNGTTLLSSFDHQQKYGLPKPIDAKEIMKSEINGRVCESAHMDDETADLIFQFSHGLKLHVFNFTGYEIWTALFPDGTGEYSNYALSPKKHQAT